MNAARLVPRVLMLVVVAVALLGGLGAGLARLGVPMDAFSQSWAIVHGPLMISGFLGTLICLERAVALAAFRKWSMAVPLVNALGALALLLARDSILAKALLTAGSLGLVLMFGVMLRLHPTRDIAIMAAGAACWLVGNILWLAGAPVFQAVHWWTAFLILTIVGERLELSRVRRLTPVSVRLLLLATGIYLLGTLLTLVRLDLGMRVLGLGAISMAAWLLRYDVARRTIRQTGLTRYIAACLLSGYVWLGIGGLIAIWKAPVASGLDYESVLHAFLLGFVFSMIFGHMPLILPALSGLRLNYHPLFYMNLVLLHVTLVARILGNLTPDFALRQWGGLLNVITVLLFLAMTILTLARSNLGATGERRPVAPSA
ncbi:MAG: hypothetical protein IT323_05595 [Anaerolineae bacterium]|nr:hypothetical protein [Anaerolineae bacterium]